MLLFYLFNYYSLDSFYFVLYFYLDNASYLSYFFIYFLQNSFLH